MTTSIWKNASLTRPTRKSSLSSLRSGWQYRVWCLQHWSARQVEQIKNPINGVRRSEWTPCWSGKRSLVLHFLGSVIFILAKASCHIAILISPQNHVALGANSNSSRRQVSLCRTPDQSGSLVDLMSCFTPVPNCRTWDKTIQIHLRNVW